MRTEFFMPMKPPTATHQEKQVRIIRDAEGKPKPQFYEPAELKAVRSKLEAYLSRHIPKKKYTGAIQVVVKWCFPITGKHYDGEPKTTKPDCDNSVKLLLDCCTGLGFWSDDAIVTSLVVEKFWAEKPGIYVCIEDL